MFSEMVGKGGRVEFLSDDVRLMNLLIRLDVSSSSSWICSVSKIACSRSFGSLMGAVIFLQSSWRVDLCHVKSSIMMSSHTTSISVGSSFSMGSLALPSGEVVYHYQQILSPRQWS